VCFPASARAGSVKTSYLASNCLVADDAVLVAIFEEAIESSLAALHALDLLALTARENS
jgi:hypothetical protein